MAQAASVEGRKLGGQQIGESVFDVAYLVFVIGAGIFMIASAAGRPALLWYGIMAVTLGAGDSFHLVPRVLGYLVDAERWARPKAIGKACTSVTMTAFYVILYLNAANLLGATPPTWLTILVWVLALVRVVLCLMPQNRWTSGGDVRWGIIRNVPFAALGIVVAATYAVWGAGTSFSLVWLAILLSFGFYLPVVLWADTKPQVGMLMIPKTCAYVWLVCMGFSLL
jgi:hypothetical protein